MAAMGLEVKNSYLCLLQNEIDAANKSVVDLFDRVNELESSLAKSRCELHNAVHIRDKLKARLYDIELEMRS